MPSVSVLFSEIQDTLFEDVSHSVRAYFVTKGPLACIVYGDSDADIYIHQVLNQVDTPSTVIGMILKHELLHLRIPSVIEGDKVIQHPPEFREAERELSPELPEAWHWIWTNFCCLKKRPRLERIDVLPNWRSFWCEPSPILFE